MEIWTQLFITNWALISSLAIIDQQLLSDRIEQHSFWGLIFGLWDLISWISIPVWTIYTIWF